MLTGAKNKKNNEVVMKLPKKRKDVLYVRVSSAAKKWLQDMAGKKDVSLSVLVEALVDEFINEKMEGVEKSGARRK
jgi:predicted site-specific integrase-resolvase